MCAHRAEERAFRRRSSSPLVGGRTERTVVREARVRHVAEMWAARCSVKLASVSRTAKEEGFRSSSVSVSGYFRGNRREMHLD